MFCFGQHPWSRQSNNGDILQTLHVNKFRLRFSADECYHLQIMPEALGLMVGVSIALLRQILKSSELTCVAQLVTFHPGDRLTTSKMKKHPFLHKVYVFILFLCRKDHLLIPLCCLSNWDNVLTVELPLSWIPAEVNLESSVVVPPVIPEGFDVPPEEDLPFFTYRSPLLPEMARTPAVTAGDPTLESSNEGLLVRDVAVPAAVDTDTAFVNPPSASDGQFVSIALNDEIPEKSLAPDSYDSDSSEPEASPMLPIVRAAGPLEDSAADTVARVSYDSFERHPQPSPMTSIIITPPPPSPSSDDAMSWTADPVCDLPELPSGSEPSAPAYSPGFTSTPEEIQVAISPNLTLLQPSFPDLSCLRSEADISRVYPLPSCSLVNRESMVFIDLGLNEGELEVKTSVYHPSQDHTLLPIVKKTADTEDIEPSFSTGRWRAFTSSVWKRVVRSRRLPASA